MVSRGAAQLGKMGVYVSRPLLVLWVVGWFLFAGVSNMGVTRWGKGGEFQLPPFCWWACNPYALRLAMYGRYDLLPVGATPAPGARVQNRISCRFRGFAWSGR